MSDLPGVKAPASRIPDNWSHLTDPTEKQAAWLKWMVYDLIDRGMDGTARLFAQAHGVAWPGTSEAGKPRHVTPRMSFGGDPFGGGEPVTNNKKGRAAFKQPLK